MGCGVNLTILKSPGAARAFYYQGHSQFNELLSRRGVPRFCSVRRSAPERRGLAHPAAERAQERSAENRAMDSHSLLSIDHIQEAWGSFSPAKLRFLFLDLQ